MYLTSVERLMSKTQFGRRYRCALDGGRDQTRTHVLDPLSRRYDSSQFVINRRVSRPWPARSYITDPRLTIGSVDIRIAVEAVKYWRTACIARPKRAYHWLHKCLLFKYKSVSEPLIFLILMPLAIVYVTLPMPMISTCARLIASSNCRKLFWPGGRHLGSLFTFGRLPLELLWCTTQNNYTESKLWTSYWLSLRYWQGA